MQQPTISRFFPAVKRKTDTGVTPPPLDRSDLAETVIVVDAPPLPNADAATPNKEESGGHSPSLAITAASPTNVPMVTSPQRGKASPRNESKKGVSDYERLRQERIARNRSIMGELGLRELSASLAMRAVEDEGGNKMGEEDDSDDEEKRRARRSAKRAKREANLEATSATRLRRSRRLMHSTNAMMEEADDDEEARRRQELEAEAKALASFVDSNVVRYKATTSSSPITTPTSTSSASTTTRNETTPSLRPKTGPVSVLVDEALKRTYTMSFHPTLSLLACAGDSGRCAVFETAEKGTPLFSFRAARGWVSSAIFLDSAGFISSSSKSDSAMLLISGNDGAISLYDLSRARKHEQDVNPFLTFTTREVHYESGIFDMKQAGGEIVSCARNATVAHSRLSPDGGGLSVLRRYDDEHDGVVKTVALDGSPNIFASGGNDRRIFIYDARCAKPTMKFDSASRFALNCVKFAPSLHASTESPSPRLLSSSFGNTMEMHELRMGGKTAFTMRVFAEDKTSSIYKPAFVRGGSLVAVTCACKSNAVSLFDASNGALLSRGDIDWSPTGTIEIHPGCDGMVAVPHGVSISLFEIGGSC